MQGIWTALITPFTSKNEIDLVAFRRILRNQKEAGVAGVVPCGTTGESPTLSLDEKKLLITTALEELKGSSVEVMAGSGTNDTRESIEFSRWVSEQGVRGILVVTPYYNKPSQAGLISHYQRIADSVHCEVVLYNVPGRTGVSLSAESIAQLSRHPRIRSVKEASGNIAFASEIIDQLDLNSSQLDLLSGDDATFLPFLAAGGVGAISVASNLFPRAMIQLWQKMRNQQVTEALKIHQKYYPLFRDLFIESNPVPIKYAMEKAGWCQSHVRSPLAPLMESSRQKLDLSMKRCGIQLEALL
jgi:4-hydroxy-tetrahydrodipicolinate synthase